MRIICPKCDRRFEVDPVVRYPSFRVRCSRCQTRAEIDGGSGEVLKVLDGARTGGTVVMERPNIEPARTSGTVRGDRSGPAERTPTPVPPAAPPRPRVVASAQTPVPRLPRESKSGRVRTGSAVPPPPPPWHASPRSGASSAAATARAPEPDVGGWAEKPGMETPEPPATHAPVAPVAATVAATAVQPAPAAAPQLDPEVERFRSELHDARERLMAEDPHAVLGVTQVSPQPEVMKAYLALSERWRPTRWEGRLPAEDLNLLRELSAHIDECFNEVGRRQRRLGSGRRATPPPVAVRIKGVDDDVPPPSEAEVLYSQGKEAFNRGHFGEARELFERCTRLEPDSARYHLKLGQAATRLEVAKRAELGEERTTDAVNLEEVKAHFDRALELEPEGIEVLLGYGHFLKARGEVSKAMRYFKQVRDLDRKNHEANREIRLYLSRKRRGQEPTTAVGKIKKLLTTKI